MPKENILVFIPMYNCENQIARVLSRFTPDVRKKFTEILVVDNRSKDQSIRAAREALEKLDGIKTTLVQNDMNFSLGGSHKVAFNYALTKGYDYLAVLHGDDQGQIDDLVRLLDENKHHEVDALLGSRFHRGSRLVGYSRLRTLGNILFNMGCSLILRAKITDMGSGLNLYHRNSFKDQRYLFFNNNLTFNVQLLFYQIHTKQRVVFFPITWSEEDQVSNAKVMKQGLIILKLLAQYLFAKNKLFPQMENEFSTTTYSYHTIFSR